MDIIFTVGLARARNVRALPSTCRATGTIFSRDIHSTTVYRGGSYRHRGHPRHDCFDQGIWKISRPTSPHPHSCNRANAAFPVPENSGVDSTTFWSTLSAPGTTDHPTPTIDPMVKMLLQKMQAQQQPIHLMLLRQVTSTTAPPTEIPCTNLDLPKWESKVAFGVYRY